MGAMALSAVVTTGIYCTGACSASPHPGNVRTYQFAAAAEAAGFRACYRCRPYRNAGPSPWLSGPELVCRAVHAICNGALDSEPESALAARLGVSARHLRRLFDAHVGATPDQLARSRRAHFARRLLDDTDLPVADVAFASGFGSVRQMNRVMVEIFRGTPRELRARRRRADRLAADGGLVLRLPFAGPLAFDHLLAYFEPRLIPGVESIDAGVYRRTVVVGGDPGMIEVGYGGADHLILRAHLPHWGGLIHVVERVRQLFGLDGDPAAVAAALGSDPILGALVDKTPGLRVPCVWDPFEWTVRVILGQQVSVAAATTMAGRIVAAHGELVPGLEPFGLTHCFPDAATLATADLAPLGVVGTRARAVNALAGAVAGGSIDLDELIGLEEIEAKLTALPGIGPWTAQCIAIRLGERDAFPSGDLGLRRAVSSNGTLASVAEVEQRAEAWRPWRASAAMYLWSTLA